MKVIIINNHKLKNLGWDQPIMFYFVKIFKIFGVSSLKEGQSDYSNLQFFALLWHLIYLGVRLVVMVDT